LPNIRHFKCGATVITTTDGDIVFNVPFGEDNNNSIITTFMTDKYIPKFIINKVTAKYNGSIVDLTENSRVSYQLLPTPVEINSITYNNCPSKILDFAVRTGILKSSYGDDYVLAVIDYGNNNEEEYVVDIKLTDILQNEDNFGKKVKFILKKEQHYGFNMETGPMNENCNQDVTLTDIVFTE
jgi:hypothetical protein